MLAQPSIFLFLFQVYFMPSALKRKPCCSDYISVLLYFLKRILCFVFTLYRLGSRQIWSGRLRRCAESFVVCSELGYYRTHHRSRHHRRLHLPSLCEPVPSHESTSIQRCMSRGCVRQWKRLYCVFEERFLEAFLTYQTKMDSNNLWFDLLVLLTPRMALWEWKDDE